MKQLKWLTLLILVGILFSCNNNHETFDNVEKTIVNDEFTVSKIMAEDIANSLLLVNATEKSNNKPLKNATIKSKKKVKSILEVPDKNGITAYFIINYEKGGFVILAGDKRSEPVLAFSEANKFDLEADYYPAGLVSWLYSTKENIENIRDNKENISPEAERQWNNLQKGGADIVSYESIESQSNSRNCTPYTIQKGPFIQTSWGQGCNYNSQTPSSCSNNCGHALTGCVATAMAQVMKYHRSPTSYSWSSMPNSYGTPTTARLMRDIGNAVNMNYGCNGSGANTQREVASSFRSDFRYRSASYSRYNSTTVKNELNANRPVILRGGRKSGWWIFAVYKDGHAWVCDGYLNTVNPCRGSTLKFNMNWGWDGSYNGWFSTHNFNPGSSTFNYKRGMVHNIIP